MPIVVINPPLLIGPFFRLMSLDKKKFFLFPFFLTQANVRPQAMIRNILAFAVFAVTLGLCGTAIGPVHKL
jgi:hypothetical protein